METERIGAFSEPWTRFRAVDGIVTMHIEDALEGYCGYLQDFGEVEADRIVACVNALAGLDPEKLAALLRILHQMSTSGHGKGTISGALYGDLLRLEAAYDALTGV